eukprot:UN24652
MLIFHWRSQTLITPKKSSIRATVNPPPQGRRRTPRDKDGPRLKIFDLKLEPPWYRTG